MDKETQTLQKKLGEVELELQSQKAVIKSNSDALLALADSIKTLIQKVEQNVANPPKSPTAKLNTNNSETLVAINNVGLPQNMTVAYSGTKLRNSQDITQFYENFNFLRNSYDLDFSDDVTTASVRGQNMSVNNANNSPAI